MKAIGIKYLNQYLNKEISLNDTLNLIKKDSRRYAKDKALGLEIHFLRIIYNKIYTGDSKFTNKAVKALNLLYT